MRATHSAFWGMLLGISLSISGHASAEMMLGPGVASCGKFVSDEDYVQTLRLGWALGYLSALAHLDDALRNTDAEAIKLALIKDCREHPLDDFVFAVYRVYLELQKKRQRL